MKDIENSTYLDVFQKAVVSGKRWKVIHVEFNETEKYLIIQIHYINKMLFSCPICQSQLLKPVSKQIHRTGYYSFLGYKSFIEAPEIIVHCKEHGKQKIENPWNQKIKSHF